MKLATSKSLVLATLITLWTLPARAAISFSFNPDAGTPQNVIDGFNAAADMWSSVLMDDIAVRLDVGFQSMPAGVLGRTSYSYLQQDYSTVAGALRNGTSSADDASAYGHLQPGASYSRLINHTTDSPSGANSATPYVNTMSTVSLTRANARVLGLLAPDGQADARIVFSSNLPFDFNPNDGITSLQYDFVGIAAHEIGHALGFASVINELEQIASSASELPATILDLFRFSSSSLANGPGFIDCTADARDKFISLNGGASSLAPMSTGAVYGNGYQADHYKEFTFTGLMDPQTFSGFRRSISNTDRRAFDALGYRVPEPSTGAMLLVSLARVTLRPRSRPDVRGRTSLPDGSKS